MVRKKMIIGLIIGVVAVFTVFFLTGDAGIATFFQTRHRIDILDKQIAEVHRDIDSLKNEIARLRSDTAYIEKIAREKYGMARSNETMYKFIEEK